MFSAHTTNNHEASQRSLTASVPLLPLHMAGLASPADTSASLPDSQNTAECLGVYWCASCFSETPHSYCSDFSYKWHRWMRSSDNKVNSPASTTYNLYGEPFFWTLRWRPGQRKGHLFPGSPALPACAVYSRLLSPSLHILGWRVGASPRMIGRACGCVCPPSCRSRKCCGFCYMRLQLLGGKYFLVEGWVIPHLCFADAITVVLHLEWRQDLPGMLCQCHSKVDQFLGGFVLGQVGSDGQRALVLDVLC